MFLAAAVSAACSLKVIIPQHPAPVVRKCNVLCSARDHASPPPLALGADTNIDRGPVQLFLVSQPRAAVQIMPAPSVKCDPDETRQPRIRRPKKECQL